ncbi:hypothetical protein GCM10011325_19210 [Dyadobacter sediminis]|nr:hypothetical protein GCM10011325_19210 [Dyadobacter sediminis]
MLINPDYKDKRTKYFDKINEILYVYCGVGFHVLFSGRSDTGITFKKPDYEFVATK